MEGENSEAASAQPATLRIATMSAEAPSASSKDSLDLLDEKFGDPVYPGTDASATLLAAYKQKVEQYSTEMMTAMTSLNLEGEELWTQFTCCFRVPTIQNMNAVTQLKWITHLRRYGILILQPAGGSMWKSLRDCLLSDKFPEGTFATSNAPHQQRNATTSNIRNREGSAVRGIMRSRNRHENHGELDIDNWPKVPTRNTANSMSNRTGSSSYVSQGVSSIVKVYSSKKKFRGSFDEDFNAAVKQFETMASVFELSIDEMAKAFPTMLDGSAFQHYTRLFKNEMPTYERQLQEFRKRYISPEQQQRILQKWQKPSLSESMRNNPDKSEMEVFRELTDELCAVQMQLPSTYHNDIFLRDKLILSVDIPHIHELLLDNVPETSHEAMQRIAARLSYDPKSAGANLAVNDDECNYVLDRKFGGDARRKLKGSNKKSKQRISSRTLASVKGCWVCRQDHQARKFHTKKQVMDAIEKIKKDNSSSVNICELLSDQEWALSVEDSDSSDDEKEENDESKQKSGNESNLVLLELEENLANSSFVHGRSFTKDMERNLAIMCTELKHGETTKFNGVVIDTGANRCSVMSIAQYSAYCAEFQIPKNIKNDNKTKSLTGLGGHKTHSMGIATIAIPFTDLDLIIDVDFVIIRDNTTTILSLKDLKDNGLDISVQRCKMTFNNKEQDLFLDNYLLRHKWKQNELPYILYTEAQLKRLHRNFGHPSASALYKLLKRADFLKADEKTKVSIQDIVQKCVTCQKYSSPPRRFKLTIGSEELQFNHIVAVDMMFIRKKPVLHIVDEATHFSAAQFLRSHSSADVWRALLRCWSRTYLGPPDYLRVDQGSNFVSNEFLDCATADGISVLEAPIESPSTMSHVERYHGPLRKAYLKIRESLPRGDNDNDCLQLAVKGMNDTVGPEGLCPTLLVFGTIPRPNPRTPAPNQVERARALDGAREELLKEYAKRRVAFGLRHPCNPKSKEQEESLRNLPYGSAVLVFRDKSSTWEGPFEFISITGNTVVVQLPHGRRIFRSTAVKPFPNTTTTPAPINDNETKVDNSCTQTDDSLTNHAYSVQGCDKILAAIHQDGNIDFSTSRQEELTNLMKREVFEIVQRTDAPSKTRIYGCRFVDTIKENENGEEYNRSRLVAQNFKDKNALHIMTKSPTVSRLGQRIAISTATLFPQHHSYIRDVSQAYVQSDTFLNRAVYLKPPKEMSLPADKLLLVKKPLYGIPESGLHWFTTYHNHHRERLNMQETRGDRCVLFKRSLDEVDGLTILQVDDSFGHGTEEFLQHEEKESNHFQCKPRIVLQPGKEFKFNGIVIRRHTGMKYSINQSEKLRGLSKAINEDTFTRTRAKIQYIGSCTRPDVSSRSQLLSSTLTAHFPQRLKQLNKLIEWCHETCEFEMQYVPLQKDTLRLLLFTDASFANADKLRSQIGFVLVLADDQLNGNIIHYGSVHCKRVTRSVMAAELLALVYGFDQAYVAQDILQQIIGVQVPIDGFIDSKTVFNVVAKAGATLEKRLQIDVSALRESHDRNELRCLSWIPGHENYADGLTKDTFSAEHPLWNLMKTNKVNIHPQGWIEENSRSSL